MIAIVLTAVAVGLVAGFAGGSLSRLIWHVDAPDGPKAIRTTNLALVDDQGRERGIFALVNNRPVFLISDEHRLPSGDTILMARIAIGILEDGAPSIELGDPDGKRRASLTVTPNGCSVMEMMARSSKARVTLSVTADGQIALTSFDETGGQLMRWP
jgi:hypothetical protein